MKSNLTIAFVAVSVILGVALAVIKHGDNTQLAADAGTILDYSNRLDSATTLLAVRAGTIDGLSNRLEQSESAALAFSNQLTVAQASLAVNTDQLAKLNQQVAVATTENQDLSKHVTGLTNQVASLTGQLARTSQELADIHRDFTLLENRFRRDVAERILLERKFNTYAEVATQADKLLTNSGQWATPQSIYKGLDVEVKSKGEFHVISPD